MLALKGFYLRIGFIRIFNESQAMGLIQKQTYARDMKKCSVFCVIIELYLFYSTTKHF